MGMLDRFRTPDTVPLATLTASAAKIAGRKMRRTRPEAWQEEAWCVDDATEILTVDGWRRHDEIDVATLVYTLDHDTGLAGWEPVEKVERFDVVDEPMLAVEMRHHSSLTTLAHRWPVLRQRYDGTLRREGRSDRAGHDRVWTTSRDLRSEDKFVTAAPSRDLPTEPKWSDAFVELVAWFWTEGTVRSDRANPSVTITQSTAANPGHVARIRRALTALYGPPLDGTHPGRTRNVAGWRETNPRDDIAAFRLNVAAAEPLLAVAPNKVVGVGFLRELTEAQMRTFIDVSCLADGHDNGYPARVVRQRSRDRLDALTVACVLAGMTPHVWYGPAAEMWEASIMPRETATPYPKRRREVRYTGTVWCPVTPSGSWLARRDGTVWYTGNTFYDEVGEVRFVANVTAHAMSRARVFAASVPEGSEDPHPLESDEDTVEADVIARQAVASLGGGPLGRAELIRRLGVQLFVAGDGFLLGLPPGTLATDEPDDAPPDVSPNGDGSLRLADLDWHILSVAEVQARGDDIALRIGDEKPVVVRDGRYLAVRVWRSHPRRWWTADSPVRSNLPVLRELVGLTKHVGASIDSRLAGAGLLLLRGDIEVLGSAGDPETAAETGASPFVDALIEAMITPIEERDSAAAIVPLVAKVNRTIEDVRTAAHLIRFDTPLDEHAKELRDEAIRRLALGLDVPPEILLGISSLSHWSAWAVKEENVTTHVSPPLALACDALTTQYLWPILREAGVDAETARRYVVWYDTSELLARPNRSDEALRTYEAGELDGRALRRELGFDEEDAPTQPDRAVEIALRMVQDAPGLIVEPGIDSIVTQLRAAIEQGTAAREAEEGGPIEVRVPVGDDTTDGESPSDPGGTPDTPTDAPAEPAGLTSGASRA